MTHLSGLLRASLFFFASQLQAAVLGLGIGGGGAMHGISFDPYQSGHLYLGSDMGLVYESFDLGEHWQPINQNKIRFYVDLNHPSHMGFKPDGTLYWASGGCDPQVSHDRGASWTSLDSLNALLPKNCLQESLRIKYWTFSKADPKRIAVGTTKGLFLSKDGGTSWQVLLADQESFVSLFQDKNTLYQGTSGGIYEVNLSTLQAKPLLQTPLGNAAMGADKAGITFLGMEKTDSDQKRLFIKTSNDSKFNEQTVTMGRFILMSPENSSLMYYVGSPKTVEGEAIWRSEDSGAHWKQVYVSDEYAYKNGAINANPVGLYVGFWDSEFQDCQLSPSANPIIACSGNFFFKRSLDAGLNWKYPYAVLVDPKVPVSRDRFWKSTQLNPVSVFVVKRHPTHPEIIAAGLADIGCVISKDSGQSWRMCNIKNMNSVYDIAFNPANPEQIYAAASSIHDYPEEWHGDIINNAPGGIYVSNDLGENWTLLSPDSEAYNNPYLSLAIDFQPQSCSIYAGTQGKGILASFDCGKNWERLNQGFEPMDSSVNSSEQKGSLIFPRIKISPQTGDVYALHTGNRLWAENNANALHYLPYTGLYQLNKVSKTWKQLGRPAEQKAANGGGLYWKYPIDFAVDWNNPQHLYLVDKATPGTWKIAGLWYSEDGGGKWRQVQQFDDGRRVMILGGKRYLMGWSEPSEPFLYTAGEDNHFQALPVEIPLHRVNDALIEDLGFLFGTFGAGLFRYTFM